MVYTGTIDAESKAYVRFLHEEGDLTVQEIVDLCGISRASIYRCLKVKKCEKDRQLRGRPRLISPRDEQIIVQNIARLRREEGNFSCHQLRAESGLHHVSLWTMNRTLKWLGYGFMEARRKGILTEKDYPERHQLAQTVQRSYSKDFLKTDICFYLDGVSFYHKSSPMNDARAPHGKVWCKRNEGLTYTVKGSHVGSGGRVVGVIYCEQYDKLDGNFVADFVRRNFPKMFRKNGKRGSKLFVQDNCPILNCAKARKALKDIGGKLFPIPKRRGNLNPIENVFNVVKRELGRQAIRHNITSQTFEEFAQRVESTLYSVRREVVDNIVTSMYERLDLILENRGRRTKY